MFTRFETEFTSVTAAQPVDGAMLSLTETAMLETRTGWVPLSDLKAGDAVATLDGGFVPIAWISKDRTTRTAMHVPAGALDNCAAIDLTEDTRIGLEAPLDFDVESDHVSLPLAAFEGLNGIRRAPARTVLTRTLGLETEEMLWTQTGTLVHARPIAEGFFQMLSFADARAMLALREAGHFDGVKAA